MKQNVTENNKTEGCGMTKDQMIELMEKLTGDARIISKVAGEH